MTNPLRLQRAAHEQHQSTGNRFVKPVISESVHYVDHKSLSCNAAASSDQTPKRVLFVEAYDSFSENIAALLQQTLEATVEFIKIDADIDFGRKGCYPSRDGNSTFEAYILNFDALVLGPGPGNPANPSDIGLVPTIWSIAENHSIPVLGVCLGFQSLCLTYGAPVTRKTLPCHGHAVEIFHQNQDIFSKLGSFSATNYNSLEVRLDAFHQSHHLSRSGSSASIRSDDTNSSGGSCFSSSSHGEKALEALLSDSLVVLAWDGFGSVMGVKHRSLPFWGVQFHPESCKSSADSCRQLLRNWWRLVSEWNLSCRPYLGTDNFRRVSPWLTVENTSQVVEIEISKSTSMLIRELQDLTSSSTSTVQTAHLPLQVELADIAELCHNLSSCQSGTAMLESTKKGRYSIYAIPSPATFLLELSSSQCLVKSDNHTFRAAPRDNLEIFRALGDILSLRKATGKNNLPFWGGFLGFFSYEMGLRTSQMPMAATSSQTSIPDVSLIWTERTIIVDQDEKLVYIQSIRNNDSGWIAQMASRIEKLGSIHQKNFSLLPDLNLVLANARLTLPDEKAYKSSIFECQTHLLAGNSYELCLTAEACISLPSGHLWPLYNNLKRRNPVPFAAYLHLNKTRILSSSPEQFLTWSRSGTVNMVPMKGTVKKSSSMTLARATEILSSPKETAENLMIADLIRHDLYRALGSTALVEVVKLCEVVEHETVYQLVSHIRARAAPSLSSSSTTTTTTTISQGLNALAQTLPPGSMTGAPKRRSCEILAALESRPRGVYSGVLGFLDVGGGGSFSVCIRTAFSHEDDDHYINPSSNNADHSNPKDSEYSNNQAQTHRSDPETKNQVWRIGAGGAITVLSDVQAEWEEMRVKMDSVLAAFVVEE